MNQRAMDALRHRTGMDRPGIFYLYAISCTAGAVLLTWLTFRDGIPALVADPNPLLLWLLCMIGLGSLWYYRPSKKHEAAPRHRNPFKVLPAWAFYVLAIPLTAGAAWLTWYVFRYGILLVIEDPRDFYIWLICLGALAMLWRARPRKPKPPDIRLNLN